MEKYGIQKKEFRIFILYHDGIFLLFIWCNALIFFESVVSFFHVYLFYNKENDNMNNDERINNISHRIIDYMRGDLSLEEERVLMEWRKESENNERIFQRLVKLSFDGKLSLRYERAKQAGDWKRFRRKLGLRKKVALYRLLPYVAAVVIVIFSGYYLFWKGESSKQTLSGLTTISPGDSKAVLKLADGEVVYLGCEKQENVEVLNDYGICETDSLLTYQAATPRMEYHTLEIPYGGEYTLELSDGSRVWINSGSVLKFPVQFAENERRVFLLEGEAYFEVMRDEQRPFYVSAPQMTVNVLGTGFNVSSYSDALKSHVTLAHGSVEVLKDECQVVLKPDEQWVLYDTGKFDVKAVDAERVCAWRNGTLYFEKMPLEELVESLSRWYDCTFFFTSDSLKQLTFSGAFHKYNDIEYILSILEATTNIKMNINGKTVVISN